jgi:outer membrane protein with beta-barrel domain
VRLGEALGVLLLTTDVAGASAATRARPAPVGATDPDVSAAYSYLRAGEANLHGAGVSASFHFWRNTRLLADVSFHTGSFAGAALREMIFMGGLRRVFRDEERWQPFVQVVAGGARSTIKVPDVLNSSQTTWGGALGVGTDYRLSERWAVRGQADYLLLHSGAGWDGDPRLSIGLAYRLAQ